VRCGSPTLKRDPHRPRASQGPLEDRQAWVRQVIELARRQGRKARQPRVGEDLTDQAPVTAEHEVLRGRRHDQPQGVAHDRGHQLARLVDPTAGVALLVIAGKVQNNGKSVTSGDIELARKAGAADSEIHDTVLIAASFSMLNRYVDGLASYTPTGKAAYEEMGKRMVNGYIMPPQTTT